MSDDDPRPPVGARFHRSATGPGPADAEPGPTPFPLVLRGYDRARVEERFRELEAEVVALREEVRRLRAEQAETERAAGSRSGAEGSGAAGSGAEPLEVEGLDVEDKIARMTRHEAARLRVTALTDAARPRVRD